MTQFQLAVAAGIHSRSVGKIERGLTRKINRRTLGGLAMPSAGVAIALGVPQEYLDAVIKGEEVSSVQGIKFCPQCWNPGAAADPLWANVRAKFCYLCGTQLQSSCFHCGELLVSLKYKFCPMCGKPYKEGGRNS